ncbi:hypothetical protein GCM10028808_33080 [Spirosoma migulaei]
MNDNFRLRWTEIAQQYSAKNAICAGHRKITYESLFRRAVEYTNGLLIRTFNQQCIAVQVEDPIEHIAALLGILLSGNYYHSISLQSVDSLTIYLDSFNCSCLISDSSSSISERLSIQLLNPKSLQSSRLRKINYPNILPTTNFCLFTTSGTTGQPKQIIHSHQSVLTDTYRQLTANNINADDRIDLLFSLEFSASLACIFPALLSGATLVVYDLKKEGILSLPTFWEQNSITFSSLSVSTFRLILKSNTNFKDLANLRLVSIGAEPVIPTDIISFQERFPVNTVLQVAYATTETRTISEHKIRIDTPVSDSLYSVGKPVPGRTVLIQDETGRLLPANQVGEIIIQAHYIPSIYQNQPAATQQAFELLPDKKIQYATGDLGFLDTEGNLYWSGRKDFVVKINGQKVSLIQVEYELKQENSVLHAAVLYDTTNPKRSLLKAYVSVDSSFDLPTLKQSLAQRLPEIMLPDRYYLVESLPLTKTGKIDRMQLTANQESDFIIDPVFTFEKGSPDFVQLIKSVWQQELSLTTDISDYDDFFHDLGGDSLLAQSCLVELEKQIDRKLPIHAPYSYTTPKSLAYYITGYMSQFQVQCIPLNQIISNRKQAYFIPSLPGNRRMYRWIEHNLNKDFNLYYIHYEPFNYKGELIPFSNLAQQIAQAISNPAESILVGFSFGGMMAYQVALSIEQMQKSSLHQLVLLDTPLYRKMTFFESVQKDLYRLKKKVFVKSVKPANWQASWFRVISRYRNRFTNQSSQPVIDNQSINWRDSCLVAVHQYTRTIHVHLTLGCPIMLFKANDSSHFQHSIRPDFNWQPYTIAGFEEYILEAYHGQLLNSTNSHFIGKTLYNLLSKQVR